MSALLLRRFTYSVIAILFLFLLAVSTLPISSQSADPTLSNQMPTSATDIAALLVKARQQGSVDVIVGLNAKFTPEGSLTDKVALDKQRNTIQATQVHLLNLLQNYKTTLRAQFQFIPYISLTVDLAALQFLANSPDVANIREEQYMQPNLADSVPMIGADKAWAMRFDGTGWTVAIIDSGVDNTHPFLAGKVVSEACFASDCTSQTGVGSASPCKDANGLIPDYCEHGTHVAGIAAGQGVNFSGVAKDANIIAIRVFSGSSDRVNSTRMTQALEHVYSLRDSYSIAAVNMSIGDSSVFHTTNCDDDQPSLTAAVNNLRSVNIATVISAGNSAPQSPQPFKDGIAFPACISTAYAVGAVDKSDNFAVFLQGDSQTAPKGILDYMAPGGDITSSVPGGGFASKSGTSMAAPHLAGTFAILRQGLPTTSLDFLRWGLDQSATYWVDPRVNRYIPRIQVDAAVLLLPTNDDRFLHARRIPSDAQSMTFLQTIVDATRSNSFFLPDPDMSCASNFNNSVWYKFTPLQSHDVIITTYGIDPYNPDVQHATTDTVLGVYTQGFGAMNEIACNDDNPYAPSVGQSRVRFFANGLTTYYIMVAKYGAGRATYPSDNPLDNYVRVNLAPINDELIDAQQIFENTTTTEQTAGASGSNIDPGCASHSQGTVWYVYHETSNQAHEVTLTTFGSNYDNFLAVFTPQLEQLDCDGFGHDSVVRFFSTPGQTYYIVAGKNSVYRDHGANGEVLRLNVPPRNDDYQFRKNITSAPSTLVQTVTGSYKTDDEPQLSCSAEYSTTVWYDFTPSISGSLRINTAGSSYDTVVGIFTGNTGNFHEVACDDDSFRPNQSEVTFPVEVGTTYHILIGSYGSLLLGNGASLRLNLSPKNDVIGNSTVIPTELGTFAITQEVSGSWVTNDQNGPSYDDRDPTLCTSGSVSNTVWYRYTPNRTRIISLNTFGSSYDTILGVFTGNPGQLTPIACNDDSLSGTQSQLRFLGNRGTTYYIVVAHWGSIPVSTSTLLSLNMQTSLPPDTIGVFRQSDASFHLRYTNTTGPADSIFGFGLPTDMSIVGDWNGDGIDTVGVYRSSTGVFYITNAQTAPFVPDNVVSFGLPGDVPLIGDWNGDGIDGIGVYRPSKGTFYLKNTPNSGAADFAMQYGNIKETPLVGDWDGDGIDSIGIYRTLSGNWGSASIFYLTNTVCNCIPVSNTPVYFGAGPSDTPLVGDWNGDGISGIGVVRSTTNVTYLKNNPTSGIGDIVLTFGLVSDVHIAGSWNITVSPLATSTAEQPNVPPGQEIAPTFEPSNN